MAPQVGLEYPKGTSSLRSGANHRLMLYFLRLYNRFLLQNLFIREYLLLAGLFLTRLENIEKKHTFGTPFFYGSSSWARTNDPAVNSRMLYRLSY